MGSLQQALNEASVKLAEAEYKKRVAAVADARLAIERLHDDARRARVPPGWLRWP